MTIRHDIYMAKTPDMSGSIAKNRFRMELLWGIEKLLDCLDRGIEDFAVVFDYCCDIELHLDDSYEFYQVKTSSGKKFGVSWASKRSSSAIDTEGCCIEKHFINTNRSSSPLHFPNQTWAKIQHVRQILLCVTYFFATFSKDAIKNSCV